MKTTSILCRRLAPALTTLALAALTGCDSSPGPSAAGVPPPTAVTVAEVTERQLTEHEDVIGRTEAVDAVEIRPRVSGYIEEVRFQAGQKVRKGDLLFLIDARTRKATLDRADAELRRAESAVDNARAEAARAEQLLSTKAISKEESDTRRWKLADAEAALLAARAGRESARLELEFCEVRSPIDGRVSRALVTPGNNVSGVDGNTTLLTTVVSVDPIHVLSDVDEATALRFKRLALENRLERDGQGRIAVEMALADETGFPRQGYVESVDNRLNPGTGSILVRLTFPNPDELMVPGLFVRARLPVGQAQRTLLVSDRAIGTDQSQKFVLTLTSSNTVAYRPVKIGPAIDGQRVIREGLQAGEKVIVNGLAKVRPGMPVSPEPEPASPTQNP